MSSNIEDIGAQLGVYLSTGKDLKITPPENKEGHELDRKLASAACKLFENPDCCDDSADYKFSHYILAKIANTTDDEWLSFYDNVIADVANICLTQTDIKIAAGGVSDVLESTIGAIGATTGMAGRVGGESLAQAERTINEAELKTEKLKAAIIKYKILTARLNREINNRYLKEYQKELAEKE